MKSYLLLIKGSFAKWNKMSADLRQETIAQFGKFAQELHASGFMKGGDGCGERSFRIPSKTSILSDCLVNPETPDMVTGYFLIEVPSEEEAFAVAQKCPAFNCGEYVELVPCSHE
ncbi:MAG: hypothetical protein A2X86_09930 [Bdellovibrionales bacterium GWA2_49_15]|nr:MAG: hypothetical protein A2X86_09930 [Bdellovibrionales bacterium GWA2_49_15]HAZ13101.1 hypothetical protein [Bdellovibrionales bacterium]